MQIFLKIGNHLAPMHLFDSDICINSCHKAKAAVLIRELNALCCLSISLCGFSSSVKRCIIAHIWCHVSLYICCCQRSKMKQLCCTSRRWRNRQRCLSDRCTWLELKRVLFTHGFVAVEIPGKTVYLLSAHTSHIFLKWVFVCFSNPTRW